MSKPYVVETKAELTSSSLILFNAKSFDAGDSIPRFNAERISMSRTPGKMEFSYNSNPNSLQPTNPVNVPLREYRKGFTGLGLID